MVLEQHPRERGATHATDDVVDPSEEEQEGATLLRRLEAALLGREVPERLVRVRARARVRLRLRDRVRARAKLRLRLRARLRLRVRVRVQVRVRLTSAIF